MSDPRVYFAAERTLLAWVRSGLAIIGLGFVVSRFGVFLKLIAAQGRADAEAARAGEAGALGLALVLLGAAFIVAALCNHLAFVRTLPAADLPAQPLRWLTPTLALSLAALGLLMAAYLARS